jgi:hypothetical protein
MESIKVFSKALLLCGCVAAASGTLAAQTISQNAGVTTVRGNDSADAATQRQTSRGRAGVAVFRGESAAVPIPAPTPSAAPAAPTQIVGGQNLWIHNAGANEVTACSIWYDYYGRRTVQCSSDPR